MLYALITYLTPQLQIFILKPHDLIRLVVLRMGCVSSGW